MRSAVEPSPSPAIKPWGVEVVGGPSPAKALDRYHEWQLKYPTILANREPHVWRTYTVRHAIHLTSMPFLRPALSKRRTDACNSPFDLVQRSDAAQTIKSEVDQFVVGLRRTDSVDGIEETRGARDKVQLA